MNLGFLQESIRLSIEKMEGNEGGPFEGKRLERTTGGDKTTTSQRCREAVKM